MINKFQKTLTVTLSLAFTLATTTASAADGVSASSATSTTRWAPQLGVSSFALKAEGYEVGAHSGLVIGMSGFKSLGSPELDGEFAIQFLQTGGVQKGFLNDGTYMENELTMSYLAIPLGVRWKVAPWGEQPNSSIYLKGAIVPAFLMSSQQKVSVLGATIEKDLKSETNSFDLMMQAGIGGCYDVGNGQDILLDLTYVRGTSKVLKELNTINEGLVASISYSMAL